MIINNLRLSDFRNYKSASVSFINGINIITGNNAQGKTNLLESLFFLSCAKSFRAKKELDLIRFGKECANITVDISAFQRELNVSVNLSIFKKRKISVNGILQKRIIDYVGLIQTVLFSPDDLNMIKEGPSVRRRFMDIAISQLRPNYIMTLSEHNRILEHKNRILKSNKSINESLLDVFNLKLAQKSADLISYRAAFIKDLEKKAKAIHQDMTSKTDTIQIIYNPDSSVKDGFEKTETNASLIYNHLCERKSNEIESKTCLIGSHRDDLEIIINEKSAKNFASQGQIRTAVLSVKMAEREIFRDSTGEYPILLLDDVLSELDYSRRGYLLNHVSNGQILITSCDSDIFSEIEKGKLFLIEKGSIIREKEK